MVSTARPLEDPALVGVIIDSSSKLSWRQDIVLLSLAFMILFGAFLGSRPLTVPDEGRYAEIPREMVSSGDYLTPRVNGVKYFEKPPLFYWMQSASIKALGLNEWAVRLPNAFMGLLGVLMVYGLGRRLYTRRAGLLAAMSLGTFGLYSGMAHMVTLDMTVAVLISGSLCCFLLGQQSLAGPLRNRWMWAMYACAGLATLTKGLIGIIFPGMIVFTWLLLTWQWRELKTYCVPTGFLLLCAIVLPWHILVQIKNPEFFQYYIIDQQFMRYFTDLSQRQQPLWFIPTVLFGGLFPWIGFIFPAIFSAWPKEPLRSKVNNPTLSTAHINLFLLFWAALIFIFFWKSNSQLIPYVLPIYTPLAMILGRYLDKTIDQEPTHWGLRFGLGTTLLISLILVVIGALKMDFSQPTMHVTVALLLVTAVLPLLVRWRSSVLITLICLSVSASLFFISINFSYPPTDTRSIKTLALTLKPLLQKNDVVYSYQNYYQDLPVYLNQRVVMVDFYGELWHGLEHLEYQELWLKQNDFWSQWSKSSRQFMILSLSDYDAIPKIHRNRLYEIRHNDHNILVSNSPHWKSTE